jgi:2,4-dichlorophenol 6-monooxygenase
MDVAGSMNIVFKADLSRYVAHRPSILYWVLQPGSDVGGIGLGLVRCVRPWDEWLIVWGYDIASEPARGRRGVRDQGRPRPGGRRHIDVELKSTSLWGNNKWYATENRSRPGVRHGRRHPPAPAEQRPGLQHEHPGRLQPGVEARPRAAGQGRPASLLDSYEPERAPDRRADRAARQQVDRGVRADLRGARPDRHLRPRGDAGPHRRPRRRHPRGADQARGAEEGARAQGLRVQRPRRRARPALRQHRRGARRHPGAGLRPRPRAVLPPDHVAGRAAAARLARAPQRERLHQGQHARRRRHGRFTLFTGIGGEDWAEAASGCRTSWASRCTRRSSGRAGSTPTCTTTGHGCARPTRTAASWSARQPRRVAVPAARRRPVHRAARRAVPRPRPPAPGA